MHNLKYPINTWVMDILLLIETKKDNNKIIVFLSPVQLEMLTAIPRNK